jgi:two-component system, NarL family, nitrate/nitrite response regulator NarL
VVRIVILSDIRLYCDWLARGLENADGVAVLGAARERHDALRLISELAPDTVLVDMAGGDGHELVRTIATLAPKVKIVALALPDGDSHVIAAAEAGISGYVPREASLEELVAIVRRVAEGEMPCSPRVAAGLAHRLASVTAERQLPDSTTHLTPREHQVLGLISEGATNKEIAETLCIEVTTTKNHVHNILEKLQVGRRGQAAELRRAGALI